jgi:hypothetical protein
VSLTIFLDPSDQIKTFSDMDELQSMPGAPVIICHTRRTAIRWLRGEYPRASSIPLYIQENPDAFLESLETPPLASAYLPMCYERIFFSTSLSCLDYAEVPQEILEAIPIYDLPSIYPFRNWELVSKNMALRNSKKGQTKASCWAEIVPILRTIGLEAFAYGLAELCTELYGPETAPGRGGMIYDPQRDPFLLWQCQTERVSRSDLNTKLSPTYPREPVPVCTADVATVFSRTRTIWASWLIHHSPIILMHPEFRYQLVKWFESPDEEWRIWYPDPARVRGVLNEQ